MEPLEPDGAGPTSPFDNSPRKLGGEGCRRVALIGCGGGLALVGVAAIVLMTQAPALFDRLMVKVEEQVEDQLPRDLPEADRRRLGDAFQAARSAVRTSRADASALRELQGVLARWSAPARGERATVQQVRELIEALEAVPERQDPEVR